MHTRPITLLATLALVLVGSLSPLVTGLTRGRVAAVQGGVTIVSATSYQDEHEHVVLVGELRNDTGGEIALVALTATFFDASGAELAVADGIALVAQLLPGETAPFVVETHSTAAVGSARYEIVETHFDGGFGPVIRDLAVSLDQVTAVPGGGLRVDGHVTNTTDAPVRVTEVVVALCDTAGTVLRAQVGAIDETLTPGEGTAFVVVYDSVPAGHSLYRTWVTAHPAP